jgi:thioredoxin 1
VITLTAENFDEMVRGAGTPVLVEFWADWCPPCRMIAPVLEQIESERAGRLTVAKINGDENPEIVMRYRVMAFPTLNLYRDGEVVHQVIGAKPKRALLEALDRHL